MSYLRPVGLLLGLDPGGRGTFGWCLLQDSPRPPLRLHASGLGDHAAEVLEEVAGSLQGLPLLAAGIDAPLTWYAAGDRPVDRSLRTHLAPLGLPSLGGTVSAVNSLQGACLVQGMLAALLLRRVHPDLLLTEAHPKATLWLLEKASSSHPSLGIAPDHLGDLFEGASSPTSEHVRDAALGALGALAAWACLRQPQGRLDLGRCLPQDRPDFVVSPLSPSPGYWIPEPAVRR